jgi:hypothetical protein
MRIEAVVWIGCLAFGRDYWLNTASISDSGAGYRKSSDLLFLKTVKILHFLIRSIRITSYQESGRRFLFSDIVAVGHCIQRRTLGSTIETLPQLP